MPCSQDCRWLPGHQAARFIPVRKALFFPLMNPFTGREHVIVTHVTRPSPGLPLKFLPRCRGCSYTVGQDRLARRSEEHTSELQSQSNLVCRLLLEKKKKNHTSLLLKQKQKKKTH